ncbi:Ig-like domain-containing protein [Corynebacterium sp. NPDC060344]|uniref:Ig-like domain-containing protein n=1 Tax=Corynebacterium sp. NPDC060344 TaxID=3347101 RepID=UPI003653CB39
MTLKNLRRPAATTAIAGLALGLINIAVVDDAVAATVTETKTLNHECTVWSHAWGGASMNTTVNPDNVSVTYPQEVFPGEAFDVTVQPGQMRAGGENVGRVKYDIALPTGVDVSNIRLDGGDSGTGGATTIVERINASGDPDPAGQYARISGDGNTVNNGPKPGNDHPKDGLTVQKDTDFRLPAVTFTVTAPDTAGSTIVTGVRGAGVPKGPDSDANIENTISFMEDGNVWNDAVFCNADAAGQTLTSTRVIERIVAADTTLSATEPAPVAPGEKADTVVTVSPAHAGTVTATINGEEISAPVNPEDGTATLPLVFPEAGTFTVPIQFTPADERYAKPSSTNVRVEVVAPKYDSVEMSIAGPAEGTTGQKLDFTADLVPNSGDKSEVNGYITLTNNGKKIMKDGAEARIAVVGGVATFDVTWDQAGTKDLKVDFVGSEGVEGSATKTVTITAAPGEEPNPGEGEEENPDVGGEVPVDPGNDSSSSGSSDFTSFFERVWKWIVDLFTGKLTPGIAGSSNS